MFYCEYNIGSCDLKVLVFIYSNLKYISGIRVVCSLRFSYNVTNVICTKKQQINMCKNYYFQPSFWPSFYSDLF